MTSNQWGSENYRLVTDYVIPFGHGDGYGEEKPPPRRRRGSFPIPNSELQIRLQQALDLLLEMHLVSLLESEVEEHHFAVSIDQE